MPRLRKDVSRMVPHETLHAHSLNESCLCPVVDRTALGLALGHAELPAREGLFCDQPLFLSRDELTQMRGVIRASEAALQELEATALSQAPSIAQFNPGTRGVCFAYDFHVSSQGPKLIEINTNAGGLLLNLALARATAPCCAGVGFPYDPKDVGKAIETMFRRDHEAQHPGQPLRHIAVVDERPTEQWLYPEFLMYQQLFERAGIRCSIADPTEFTNTSAALLLHGAPVDLVYLRLTDFYLETEAASALRQAYLAGTAVITPGPRHHALRANKALLALLSNASVREGLSISNEDKLALERGIPETHIVTPDGVVDWWGRRKNFFFKPMRGYGSKAAYRGDKLTRGTWETITSNLHEHPYVAQALVAPSARRIGQEEILKVDVRCYTDGSDIILAAARVYQGQTTNMRTPGGGFAPVLVPSGGSLGAPC